MSNPETLDANAQLALDTIMLKPTQGIPSFPFHVLKHSYIERLARVGEGEDLVFFAGRSSTDGVLRSGTTADVKRKLKWLVETGPRTGLFISSMGIYPDMPWANVQTYVEGIQYYRKHGRG